MTIININLLSFLTVSIFGFSFFQKKINIYVYIYIYINKYLFKKITVKQSTFKDCIVQLRDYKLRLSK